VRYWCGSAGERDQLRWLLIAVGLLLASYALVGDPTMAVVSSLLVAVAIPLLPPSVGVAVLRHRLDDVEVAVRRSLVHGRLLAAGLAVYAGVVLLLDALLRGRAQPVVTSPVSASRPWPAGQRVDLLGHDALEAGVDGDLLSGAVSATRTMFAPGGLVTGQATLSNAATAVLAGATAATPRAVQRRDRSRVVHRRGDRDDPSAAGFAKLGVDDRAAAVTVALARGILLPPASDLGLP
jgi:hypothetical protein